MKWPTSAAAGASPICSCAATWTSRTSCCARSARPGSSYETVEGALEAMGFFAPTAFLAGAALLAAILATYLLRPRRPIRRVSSTFLWLAALHDLEAQRPWRRVPPSLLLLLQIAALAAIVGAVARPFVLSTPSTGPF